MVAVGQFIIPYLYYTIAETRLWYNLSCFSVAPPGARKTTSNRIITAIPPLLYHTPIVPVEYEFSFNNNFLDERFPDGFVCPKCGGREYYSLKTRHVCQCKRCRRQTSVTAGTVMHRTHLPLTVWFWAIYLCATDKRGISAKGLARQLDVSYESAWYLLVRIRSAMHDRDQNYLLEGILEMDEAYTRHVYRK